MEYHKLGKSGVRVSPVVLGCWSMGGDYFGSVEDRDSIACIETYLEHGIQTFDTAEIYGMGRAEKVLGQALKGRKRAECTIISKVWPSHYAPEPATRPWSVSERNTWMCISCIIRPRECPLDRPWKIWGV